MGVRRQRSNVYGTGHRLRRVPTVQLFSEVGACKNALSGTLRKPHGLRRRVRRSIAEIQNAERPGPCRQMNARGQASIGWSPKGDLSKVVGGVCKLLGDEVK